MLARTPASLVYLSAAELGITEREHAGLIEVRDDLASGRVKHTAKYVASRNYDLRATGFNMAWWSGSTDCGTCHCIGGFMVARGIFKQPAKVEGYDASSNLDHLFYPTILRCTLAVIDLTPVHAVRAIEHFLAGAGPDCWPMAISDIPPA